MSSIRRWKNILYSPINSFKILLVLLVYLQVARCVETFFLTTRYLVDEFNKLDYLISYSVDLLVKMNEKSSIRPCKIRIQWFTAM